MARIAGHLGRSGTVEIRVAPDALRLVEAYLCRHSRAVILDAELAPEQVVPLIHIVRQVERGCPVLLLASPRELALCARVVPLGHVSYLVKPVCARAAAELIGAALRQVA